MLFQSNHEAIIDPETFEMVQRELARRTTGKNRHSGVHLLLCSRYPYQRRSAVFVQNQTEYNKRFDALSQKFKEDEAKKDAVTRISLII